MGRFTTKYQSEVLTRLIVCQTTRNGYFITRDETSGDDRKHHAFNHAELTDSP